MTVVPIGLAFHPGYKATLDDAIGDQQANVYGRESGRQFPDRNPSDLVDYYRPNGLDGRY